MRNDTFCACSFSQQKFKHIIHKFQGPNTTIYDSMNKENRYSHLFPTTTKFTSRRLKDKTENKYVGTLQLIIDENILFSFEYNLQ